MFIHNFSKYEFYENGHVYAKNRGLFLKGSFKSRTGIHYYNITNDQNELIKLESKQVKLMFSEAGGRYTSV